MQQNEQFDYVIVGAGSAGCVVANRLSEDPDVSVLLLEAGGSDRDPRLSMPLGFMMAAGNPAYDWGLQSVADPKLDGRSLPLPRGRIIGGSSSVNGMIYLRGHPADYDTWAQMGARGWSWDDVLPYFRKAETSMRGASDFRGGNGPLHTRPVPDAHLQGGLFRDSAIAAGFPATDDLNGEHMEGFGQAEVTVDARGRRSSTSQAYLTPARRRPNLTIRSDAPSRRVLFEGKRAIGVEYEVHGRVQRVRARREVILSAGAYNSPKLLMLSGIGPREELAQLGIDAIVDAPMVGKNLAEHPLVYMMFDAGQATSFLESLRIDRAAFSVLRWLIKGDGPFASQIVGGILLVKSRPELERPDLQLVFLPVRLDAKVWGPGIGKRQDHVLSVMVLQLHPHSRGSVTLSSNDPHDAPIIDLNLLAHKQDFADIRAGIRMARKIFAAPPLGDLIGEERAPGAKLQSDEELDGWIRSRLGITQHPCGTCRMGEGADTVVDSALRVRGVEGLRVVDASVFPDVPGSNINAAVIMVGEKAADLIKAA